MTPQPPEELSASSLITAKGAELKFWIVKTNELAEKKVLNVSGNVDTLRANLATYYGLDLTINPRTEAITAPTVNEDIRDRQWADLAAMGVEWRDKVRAGIQFKLLTQDKHSAFPILSAAQDLLPTKNNGAPTRSVHSNSELKILPTAAPVKLQSGSGHSSMSAINPPAPTQPSVTIPSTINPSSAAGPVSQLEVAALDDLSTAIAGLERCEGLQAIIQQIESGAVKAIRDRYGPSKPDHRGTADASWSKYSNLVSKRERLHRILIQDFEGDKERFFGFFSVPPPAAKKRKRAANEPTTSDEHFRSFRKIVEAVPWCEADLTAERRKDQYLGADGNFSEALWSGQWKTMNSWEVWREIGRERYVKEK
ncbi:hypothetical protein C8F04DRAFT_1240162 [Mycena alexandri]|uniref:Uncharacterized protein n=1 Tax=Mycena alexandri TaxID=1745969 RepID=A0AAD6SA19_9AGAR|nr:hypothetical protein C8F04DRAFT_1240162 [Mycena alexandri]